MKIELIKQTTELTGNVYYFVRVNGFSQNQSWTSDYEEAKRHLASVTEQAKKFPETIQETLETTEI